MKDTKNNIRSFRYSDRVAQILESMEGDSLNAKFENLVIFCHDRLPEVCAPNIFGKNSQHFCQNILGKREPEIVLFKLPFLSLILRILL
ncbi:MAG: hypothetical protein E7244_08870 [Enterocloster citroniae]|nr:hypothetical protein [Enterocloster citroniae]